MKYLLEPADEYTHPVTASERFNESVYCSLFDAKAGVGGFLRLGNQPCEGYAETTVCLYLPDAGADGRVAFAFGRPPISGNDRFDAGGMRFDVVEPFVEVAMAYSGKLGRFESPRVMTDPKSAFTNCPYDDAHLDLHIFDVSPVSGGTPVLDDGGEVPASGMFLGHTEQHVAVKGSVRIGDFEGEIDGFGVRDHSWGRRSWQSNPWYRWLTATFDGDCGVLAATSPARPGETGTHVSGTFFTGGRLHPIERIELSTTWDGERYPAEIVAQITSGAGQHELRGRVVSDAPLRNRKKHPDGTETVSRIVESLTEWTLDGRTAWGLSEYLDTMVDGIPAGMSH
jgi:hypothetical protein